MSSSLSWLVVAVVVAVASADVVVGPGGKLMLIGDNPYSDLDVAYPGPGAYHGVHGLYAGVGVPAVGRRVVTQQMPQTVIMNTIRQPMTGQVGTVMHPVNPMAPMPTAVTTHVQAGGVVPMMNAPLSVPIGTRYVSGGLTARRRTVVAPLTMG